MDEVLTPVEQERAEAARQRLMVYDRDDWTCWLCVQEVDPTLPRDHPRYPSLDHVHPKSMGGPKVVENLRCAHRACNSHRGCEDPHSVAAVEVYRRALAEAEVRWYAKQAAAPAEVRD